MELDNLALESVMDARRKAVQTSIRQISTEELNSLVTEILFEDPAHPWCEIFRQFIRDNASAVFYQASTTELSGVPYDMTVLGYNDVGLSKSITRMQRLSGALT